MRVTFLGTGTSRGIPVIGCKCGICRSNDPKNQRLRTSVLIESRVRVVIDTSVDFRIQMLRYGVRHLDAVVYTHHHMDHVLGLDDVYPFNLWSKKAMAAYASPETAAELKITFRHLFNSVKYPGIPKIDLRTITGEFQIGDLNFEPIEVFHGGMSVLAFRIGAFAYVTDVNYIPPENLEKLCGVRFLALDGLRYKSHPTHFSLSEAAQIASRIGAEKTFLIHMSHEVEHEAGNRYLPDPVSLAYDGLVLEI